MQCLSTARRRLAATASVLAIAGAAAFLLLTSGAPASATPKPSTAPAGAAASASCRAKAVGRRHPLLARTDYATVEIRRHGHFETVVLDRGDVTAVSSTRITVKRPDGVTVTIALDPMTRYLGASGESGLRTGHPASVISVDGSALRVAQIVKAA